MVVILDKKLQVEIDAEIQEEKERAIIRLQEELSEAERNYNEEEPGRR
jgi:hypothetical protein